MEKSKSTLKNILMSALVIAMVFAIGFLTLYGMKFMANMTK